MDKKRLFIFTTTRADYSLLRWIVKEFMSSSEFETYIIVGGMHLSEMYGYTIEEILTDGVKNIIQIPFLSASSIAAALVSSIGNGLIQISQISMQTTFLLIIKVIFHQITFLLKISMN